MKLMINPELWTIDEVVVGDKTIRHGEGVEVSDSEAKTVLAMTSTHFGREVALVVEAGKKTADNAGGAGAVEAETTKARQG